jgi:hypothetical protein
MGRMMAAVLAMIGAMAAAHAGATASPLVGSWFGKGLLGEPNTIWVERYQANGHFSSLSRYCANTLPEDTVEYGTWRMVGDVLEIATLSENGTPLHTVDRYREQMSDDGRTRVSRLIVQDDPDPIGENLLVLHKVADDFQLQTCRQ